MEQQRSKSTRAGGAVIAISILLGALIGIVAGQPSAGTVSGAAIGMMIALALYLYDRRQG